MSKLTGNSEHDFDKTSLQLTAHSETVLLSSSLTLQKKAHFSVLLSDGVALSLESKSLQDIKPMDTWKLWC